MVTSSDFDPDESFEQALFRAAEAQIQAGHHFLAVVTAQAAVEAVAQTVFSTLFSINLPRSLETMDELLPDRSFMAKGTRLLWHELTGENIADNKDVWKPYHRHVERRNPAAHGAIFGWPKGDPITEEEARESIGAARAFTTYLLTTFKSAMDELVGPGGERMAEEDQWRALRIVSSRPATAASERMASVVRALREERGLSVDELARSSKLHTRSIERIESGWTEPSLTMLVPISRALGVSVAALVERAALDDAD